ncbi:MAG TPA: tetratricopeptide repeat protein, partial [Candidatus Krumholzibacterium sp.]|nr:tetratricopeptide repeat protein [Candidatus Krumholzibacterium sp.]
MIEVDKILSRVETLLEKEDYRSVILLAEGMESPEGPLAAPSFEHKRISLCLARAKYHIHDYQGTSRVLSGLKILYPGIEDEKDHLFLESQLLLMKGDAAGAIRLLDHALESDRPKEDEFFIRFCLAKASFWKGDYLTANLLLEACRHYYGTREDAFMLGNVNYMLGYTAFQRSFFDQADSWYSSAIECYEKSGSDRQVAAAWHMTGILRYRTGKYAEAEQLLRKSGKAFEKSGDQAGVTESLIARARVHMYRGELEESEALLQRAYSRAGSSGYKRGTALSAEFLGEIAMRQGKTERALRYLEEARELGDGISREGDIAAEVCRRLGDLYIMLGDREKASENLSRALEISVKLHDDHELACVLRGYALLESQRGCYELSLSYFNEAISLLRMINERFELACTCMTAARAFSRWSTLEGEDNIDPRQLLRDARVFATEAAHLYQSLGLEDRIEECERLAGRLLNENYRAEDLSGCRAIEFSGDWICEDCIVARSPQMKQVVAKTLSLAGSRVPVLITGETGTGKE